MKVVRNRPWVVLAWMTLTGTVYGQWLEQSITLEAGWNAVFIEVDPQPANADELFSSQPFVSVWTRTPQALRQLGDDCEGPDDTDCMMSNDTQWRVWVPPGSSADVVVNLRVIRGGRVYFINATQATTLTLVGRPSSVQGKLLPGANAVGFYASPTNPPTFENYLAPETTLSDSEIFAFGQDGVLTPVSRSSSITPSRGYWMTTEKSVDYDGPVQIDALSLRGLDYGDAGTSRRIGVRNLAGAQTEIAVAVEPSAAVPTTIPPQPTNAGAVPLFWKDYGSGSEIDSMVQWRTLNSLAVPTPSVDVGIRRVGLSPASVDSSFQGSQYQSLIRIESDLGFRRYLGVTAEVSPSLGLGDEVNAASGNTGPRPGLYVGRVRVDQVAWITADARTWSNDDVQAPEFASVMRCDGGPDDGAACFPDRKRCVGSPELDLMAVSCESDVDCPLEGSCATITDCLAGTCRGFCIGGDTPSGACDDSTVCGDGGVCSADVNTSELRPVAYPFEFTILIHLDEFGEYRLLTEVAFLANDSNAVVLATPSCDSAFCDSLEGALYVNGERQAQRISTPAFSFDGDLPLSGSFDSMLNGIDLMPPDHPLNPFKHKFHPDSDCDQAGECYEVTRAMVLAFEPVPPSGLSELDWGDSVLGGVFTEHVTGLHRETITAQGRFRIERISQIGVLNTPVGGTGEAQ